jgi:two-component sensor histidine kinase
LVTNAYQHAFPDGRKGTVEIGLHCSDNNLCTISVRDDGVGMDSDINVEKTRTLGLLLIRTLTGQLGGKYTIYREPGTQVLVTFEISEDSHSAVVSE